MNKHKYKRGDIVKLVKAVVDTDDILFFRHPGEIGHIQGYDHDDRVRCSFGYDTVCKPEAWFAPIEVDAKELPSCLLSETCQSKDVSKRTNFRPE